VLTPHGCEMAKKSDKKSAVPAKKPAARSRAEEVKVGPTEPSRATVKRLFAVSGNQCAFPKCRIPLVDPESGSIIGAICHIKGDKPGSKRYDASQPKKERHGFGNLILMCGRHHKVIDDDARIHTVDRLLEMKQKHEAGQPKGPNLTNAQADKLIVNIRRNAVKDGSIIQTQHQSGGQAAHVINNYNSPPPEDDKIVVEGSLSIVGRPELLKAFGCPGLELTVTCRSKRPAKIRKADLSTEGRGFVAALQRGWGVPFGHNPPEGLETEVLSIELARLSPPNSPEGYSLNRDDVCRFYLPMCSGGLGLFLTAKPNDVFIRVIFFDDSERVILRGEQVQDTIRGMLETHGRYAFSLKIPTQVTVTVKSTTLPDLWPIAGTTNPNPISFIPADSVQNTPARAFVQAELGVVEINPTREFTLGARVMNSGIRPLENVAVTLSTRRAEGDVTVLPFIPTEQGPCQPGQLRLFLLRLQDKSELKRLLSTFPPSHHSLMIRSGNEDLLRLPGEYVQAADTHLTKIVAGYKAGGA
jgi:hypothetical protein